MVSDGAKEVDIEHDVFARIEGLCGVLVFIHVVDTLRVIFISSVRGA